MDKVNSQGRVNILTEEELAAAVELMEYAKQAFTTMDIVAMKKTLPDKIIAIVTSHRAIQERNRLLVLENDELNADNQKYKKAYDKCAVGGNSLASVIIGWSLPKVWQDWTYVQARDFMYGLYGEKSNMAYERYEIWLCWKSIKEAGQTLEEFK